MILRIFRQVCSSKLWRELTAIKEDTSGITMLRHETRIGLTQMRLEFSELRKEVMSAFDQAKTDNAATKTALDNISGDIQKLDDKIAALEGGASAEQIADLAADSADLRSRAELLAGKHTEGDDTGGGETAA